MENFIHIFEQKVRTSSWGVRASINTDRTKRLLQKVETLPRTEEQLAEDTAYLENFTSNWKPPRSSFDSNGFKPLNDLIKHFENRYNLADKENHLSDPKWFALGLIFGIIFKKLALGIIFGLLFSIIISQKKQKNKNLY